MTLVVTRRSAAEGTDVAVRNAAPCREDVWTRRGMAPLFRCVPAPTGRRLAGSQSGSRPEGARRVCPSLKVAVFWDRQKQFVSILVIRHIWDQGTAGLQKTTDYWKKWKQIVVLHNIEVPEFMIIYLFYIHKCVL
jgi:hypothetical protein